MVLGREDKDQVLGNDGYFIIDTNERTNACRRWLFIGLPCYHVISTAIWFFCVCVGGGIGEEIELHS